MLRAAIVFFVLAIFAIIFGSSGMAGVSMEMGRLFLIVFLFVSGIFLIGSIFTGKRPGQLH